MCRQPISAPTLTASRYGGRMCNAPFLADLARVLVDLTLDPPLQTTIDILGTLVLSESYISHYAPGAFGHCSTCRLFNCHNTRSIAEYMLNYARQTLKRVPSFQEILQGKMGSAQEEMYVHRL